VVVSQVFTIDKAQIGEYIGALPLWRVNQILAGIQLLSEPRDIEQTSYNQETTYVQDGKETAKIEIPFAGN
jgi:hypothetical protein